MSEKMECRIDAHLLPDVLSRIFDTISEFPRLYSLDERKTRHAAICQPLLALVCAVPKYFESRNRLCHRTRVLYRGPEAA